MGFKKSYHQPEIMGLKLHLGSFPGFGFADIENRQLANPNSVMRIASISKSMTMTVVAKLWEEGKLDLVSFFVLLNLLNL